MYRNFIFGDTFWKYIKNAVIVQFLWATLIVQLLRITTTVALARVCLIVGHSIPFHVPTAVASTAPVYGVAGRQRTGSISLALGTENVGALATSPIRAHALGRRLSLNLTNNDTAGSKGSAVIEKCPLDNE